MKRILKPLETRYPVPVAVGNAELGNHESNHRGERDIARGDVAFVERVLLRRYRGRLRNECRGDMQMGKVRSTSDRHGLPMEDEQFPFQAVENPILVSSRRRMPRWRVFRGLLRNEGVVMPNIQKEPARTAGFGRQRHGIGGSTKGNRVQDVRCIPFGPHDQAPRGHAAGDCFQRLEVTSGCESRLVCGGQRGSTLPVARPCAP